MKHISQLVKDFGAARKAYKQLSEQAPKIIGDIAVKETKRNFRMQGFVGDGYSPWKERKDNTNRAYNRRGKTYKGSVYNSKNPILKQTGNLFDAIDYKVSGNIVYVGVNLNQFQGDYPKHLQEGTEHMPARKWIGFSKRFSNRCAKEMQKRRQVIFNKFRM